MEAAAAQGIVCTVICSDRSYAQPQLRYPARTERPGISVRRVRASGFGRAHAAGRLVDYVSYGVGASLAALRAPRPEVVVGLSTPPLLGAMAVGIARLRGARSVYWVMDVYPDVAVALGALPPRGLLTKALRALSAATLRSADLVVALGETMAARLEQLAPSARLAVIHNWADPGPALSAGEREAQRSSRDWSGRFVVLYSGNLGLAHEFDTVLEAAERLRADRDIVFAFVGGGPRRAELEAAVRGRGLSNVSFHSAIPRSELSASLAAADLHLVTLRPGLEGLVVPSKLYAILASRQPCLYVGPASGEVFEILRASGGGTRVANQDVLGAVAAVRGYRDDSARREREGVQARLRFEQDFTCAAQTERLIALLRELAQGSG